MTARTSSPALFFSKDTATTDIYTLSLHDALPISTHEDRRPGPAGRLREHHRAGERRLPDRSEEHTSELQSPYDLVCRLLLEKKKTIPLCSPSRVEICQIQI